MSFADGAARAATGNSAAKRAKIPITAINFVFIFEYSPLKINRSWKTGIFLKIFGAPP
jgi:hypothetical protein